MFFKSTIESIKLTYKSHRFNGDLHISYIKIEKICA